MVHVIRAQDGSVTVRSVSGSGSLSFILAGELHRTRIPAVATLPAHSWFVAGTTVNCCKIWVGLAPRAMQPDTCSALPADSGETKTHATHKLYAWAMCMSDLLCVLGDLSRLGPRGQETCPHAYTNVYCNYIV